MGRARILTEAQAGELVAAVRVGEPYAEIAERFGVAVNTVAKYAERYGVSRRRGKPNAWPDCPPELRTSYMRMRKSYGYRAAEARAMLERAA